MSNELIIDYHTCTIFTAVVTVPSARTFQFVTIASMRELCNHRQNIKFGNSCYQDAAKTQQLQLDNAYTVASIGAW
jgi:hypothetical protein